VAASADTEKSITKGGNVLTQNFKTLSFIDQEIATEVKIELARKNVVTNIAAQKITSIV
jgi:hypothetical protein